MSRQNQHLFISEDIPVNSGISSEPKFSYEIFDRVILTIGLGISILLMLI